MMHRLGGAARRGGRPARAVVDCRMIGRFHPTREPMRGLVADMQAAERRPEIASVSLVHGFPWGDVADMGAQVLVLGDDQRESAALEAAFGHRLRPLRGLTFTRPLPLASALEQS